LGKNKIILHIQGGLGNQLFQYSTARMLAQLLGAILEIDLSFYENKRFKGIYRLRNIKINHRFYKILRLLNINCKYNKKTHFREIKYKDNTDKLIKLVPPIFIEGWINNFNFFRGIKHLLEEELELKDISFIKNSIEYYNITKDNHSVAIHIRRGDYLNNPHFVNLEFNYYRKAMSIISELIGSPKFYIFSDDSIFAKELFFNIPNCNYIEKHSLPQSMYNTIGDIWDFFLMNQCRHIIIANSTFSWWAAWLNSGPQKIVVSPKKWYNNKLAQHYVDNISFMPNNWILI